MRAHCHQGPACRASSRGLSREQRWRRERVSQACGMCSGHPSSPHQLHLRVTTKTSPDTAKRFLGQSCRVHGRARSKANQRAACHVPASQTHCPRLHPALDHGAHRSLPGRQLTGQQGAGGRKGWPGKSFSHHLTLAEFTTGFKARAWTQH